MWDGCHSKQGSKHSKIHIPIDLNPSLYRMYFHCLEPVWLNMLNDSNSLPAQTSFCLRLVASVCQCMVRAADISMMLYYYHSTKKDGREQYQNLGPGFPVAEKGFWLKTSDFNWLVREHDEICLWAHLLSIMAKNPPEPPNEKFQLLSVWDRSAKALLPRRAIEAPQRWDRQPWRRTQPQQQTTSAMIGCLLAWLGCLVAWFLCQVQSPSITHD